MKDHFVADLLFSLGVLAKIAFAIVGKVGGWLSLGVVWVVVCCAASLFVPFGATLCFVIVKLIGHLSLGWGWVVVALAADCFCLSDLLRMYRGQF